MNLTILIDSREQSRVTAGKKYYHKYTPRVIDKELPVGDYIFISNNVNVVFEYKTVADFIGSVGDNRVFNQALNQSDMFMYHFVIIVGSEKDLQKAKDKLYRNTGISFNNQQWNGAIASLVEFTSVLFAKNESLAFDLMERIALKCIRDKPVIHRYPKSKGSPAYRFLSNNVNGIGEKTAEKICVDLDLWYIIDVFGLNREMLMSVNGIGRKKAVNILNQILKEYQ